MDESLDTYEPLDINKLLKALDVEQNESIINLTTEKIHNMTFKILKELHLPKTELIKYFNNLKKYRYIDELNDLKYGAFIKWIPIKDPDKLPLHAGGIICDIKITQNGVMIVCKNFMNRYYQIKMEECLIFQKLSNQEEVLLSALDHLEKN